MWYRSVSLFFVGLVLMIEFTTAATAATVVAVAHGKTTVTQAPELPPPSSGSADSNLGKDIVSNVFKAIQITNQENLFLANLFTVASKISNLSLNATDAAVHLQALSAYVELINACLGFLVLHQEKDTNFKTLITQAISDTTKIMMESPQQST